jgi:pimeloyl-ACP methyl ester carboxylesterase
MTSRRARFALVAAMLAVVLPLSGCVASFIPTPPKTTSTPTGEKVAADLEPFYGQVLKWKTCENGDFQCATAKAPMDWSTPGQGTIDLALIRKVASGTSKGSLLVNPGGPGGSGYDFVRDDLTSAVDSRLRANYDIVGFDPRGVGRSSAVSCYSDPATLDDYLFSIPKAPIYSDAWIAENAASTAAFGQDCLKYTGPLLGKVDTNSAARDLDLLRAALGDKKLNYLGYSYGTLLGATYAELYPKKTGRLVLDGALDPATSDFDVTKTQAVGFENAMKAYLKSCIGTSGCPFSGTVTGAMADVRGILDDLDASPLRNDDGRELGSATMFTAIILPLYSKDNWPVLGKLFDDVAKGSASIAFQLADSYYSRNSDGSYNDNSTEAFDAINCLDYVSDASVATMRVQAAELKKAAPTFGPQMSYGGASCATWPFTSTRERGPIAADGSAPIIVVGTTNDPATPYVWAQNLAKELQHGHLVTRKGDGHTGYNKGNACVDAAVDDFFIDNTVPKTDPKC